MHHKCATPGCRDAKSSSSSVCANHAADEDMYEVPLAEDEGAVDDETYEVPVSMPPPLVPPPTPRRQAAPVEQADDTYEVPAGADGVSTLPSDTRYDYEAEGEAGGDDTYEVPVHEGGGDGDGDGDGGGGGRGSDGPDDTYEVPVEDQHGHGAGAGAGAPVLRRDKVQVDQAEANRQSVYLGFDGTLTRGMTLSPDGPPPLNDHQTNC